MTPQPPSYILNCPEPDRSIARENGQIEVNGTLYAFILSHDALIRKDLMVQYVRLFRQSYSFEEIISKL